MSWLERHGGLVIVGAIFLFFLVLTVIDIAEQWDSVGHFLFTIGATALTFWLWWWICKGLDGRLPRLFH